jgi:hypothetical protein
MKTLAFVQREVDTIIMLRGSHLYTAWSPSQPVWTPSRTLPSIPGAWIAGGRRVPDILLLYVGRSPGALGWGGKETTYYWRLWWCEPSEHHSRGRPETRWAVPTTSDSSMVCGGQVSCFLTLEALALRRRDRGFFLIVVQIAHVRARRPARAWQRHIISFLACHAMPCHAMLCLQ